MPLPLRSLRRAVALPVATCLLVLVLVAPLASATTISGLHTTALGKTVDLSGLEWLSWDVTYGVTRTAVEAGWGGLLADGWRYATEAEFVALISSLWGGPAYQGFAPANADGADWLWENFDNPDFLSPALGTASRTGDILVGAPGECTGGDTSASCLGHWRGYTGSSAGNGWFASPYGGTHLANALSNNSTTASSALVRAVPEPANLLVLGLVLVGLGAERSRRSARARA